MFCFLISVWTLSSHSLYIYTQINICVFQFLSIYISIILCHWCLYLFLRQKWAKMQWFNTVQRQYSKGLFKNNNWNDWNWLWPLKNYALLLPVMNLGFVAVLQFATVYLFSYFFISYFFSLLMYPNESFINSENYCSNRTTILSYFTFMFLKMTVLPLQSSCEEFLRLF